jgi:hypothetical protein
MNVSLERPLDRIGTAIEVSFMVRSVFLGYSIRLY